MAATSKANSAPRLGLRPRSPVGCGRGGKYETWSERIRPSSSTGRKNRRLTGTTDCGTGPNGWPCLTIRYHRDGRVVGFADHTPPLTVDCRINAPSICCPPGRDAELHRLHRAGVPGEAVDTRTIRPGQAGCRTAPLQQGKKVTDARIGSSAPHPSHACCS
ncbi:DUF6009 family protein [Streptomyces microflavus]|uniref:DUF6009 family protein n=1 Tax=Streptomyces TaxID=1883 RepID=UPI0035716AF9